MKKKETLWLVAALCAPLALHQAAAQAQYPTKPVHVVVAFAAGGLADTVSRLVTGQLADRLGQPFPVENRGGAGGNIGARQVIASAPDGYTLLVHTAAISINASLYRKPDFDVLPELAPISNTGSTAGIFAVHASNPANTMQELIKSAKGRRLTYATAGVGTSSHLSADYLFNHLAGLDAVHIPFQGGAPALTAVVSKQVEVMSGSPLPIMPFLKQGTLKALAVSSLTRIEALPNVPTMTEAGFKDFEERSWVGFFAPLKTPGDVVRRLNGEINRVIAQAQVKERFSALGLDPAPGSSEEFGAYVKKEADKWARIIKTTGIRVE